MTDSNEVDRLVTPCLILLLLVIWVYQQAGGEEVSPAEMTTAVQACSPNGGLDYMRVELFEKREYVCKNGAEGTIFDYRQSLKGGDDDQTNQSK